MIKISVVTAVFNSAKTIGPAIESVLGQCYPDVESVVIDGGSNDGTLSILDTYRSRLGILISEPDKGIYDALNKGIQQCSGDVIGFLHSDDLFSDAEVVSKIAAVFADPSVDAVYGNLLYVSHDDPDRVVRYWRAGEFSRERLGWGWMPPHPTFYARRSVYERLGVFNTSYRIAADYDCILRFLGQGKVRVAYIPEVLVRMRVGGESNRSLSNIICKSREDYRAIRENGTGGLITLLAKNMLKLPQFLYRPDNVRLAERK
jgi:glycosyltransferase involved in cell wall biosynthesis